MSYDDFKDHTLFLDEGRVWENSLHYYVDNNPTKVNLIGTKQGDLALVEGINKTMPLAFWLPSLEKTFYGNIDQQCRLIVICCHDFEVFDEDTKDAFVFDLQELIKNGIFKVMAPNGKTAHNISKTKPAVWNSYTYEVYIGK